jgi:hypothetical protein
MSESPYLSLRQAVRPAILAHRLLAQDAERAGRLATECEDLLLLTRELLKAAGQAHLLGYQPPDSADGAADREVQPREIQHGVVQHGEVQHGEVQLREIQLRDAYAEAAMLWAKVVGSSMALAGTLLERGDWDDVRRLARFFADAGEEDAAGFMRVQLGKAVWEKYRVQLQKISNQMLEADIREAIKALRGVLAEVPEEFPDRNREVNRLLAPLAASIYAVMKQKSLSIPYDSRVEHIAAGGVARYPEIVTMSLDELSAEFEGAL